MKATLTRLAFTSIAASGLMLSAAGIASAGKDGPTCSTIAELGVDVHGQHIVRDYVMGHEGADSDWPYSGTVGSAVGANRGAAIPGGPRPTLHFPFAPGASFCTDSNSPGDHL